MIVALAFRACLKCSEWLADTLPDARCRLVVEAKGAKTHVSLTVDNVRIGTVRVLDGENRTAFAAVVGVGFVHTPSCRTLAPVLILGPWSLVCIILGLFFFLSCWPASCAEPTSRRWASSATHTRACSFVRLCTPAWIWVRAGRLSDCSTEASDNCVLNVGRRASPKAATSYTLTGVFAQAVVYNGTRLAVFP